MNSQQINYFMAVATNLSFTKTSEELFVSQPAISRQIALLEKEFGVRLFNRSNHRTELTEAGRLYYDFFSRAKTQLRNISEQVSRMENGIHEQIAVGILEGWNVDGILQQLLGRFSDKHKDAELSFNFFSLKEIKTMLLTGGIDIALTLRNRLLETEDIECIDCSSIRKLLIISKNHPLCRKALESGRELSLYDLRDETFYAPWDSVEETLARDITGYLSPYGFTPKLRFVHNSASLQCAVRCGQGAAIVNELSLAEGDPEIYSIPLEIQDHICLAWVPGSGKQYAEDTMRDLKEIIASRSDGAGTKEK